MGSIDCYVLVRGTLRTLPGESVLENYRSERKDFGKRPDGKPVTGGGTVLLFRWLLENEQKK